MAEIKRIKVVVVRPMLHDSKHCAIGTVLELPEGIAHDVLGTKRALVASDDNLKLAKEAAADAKAKADARAKKATAASAEKK